MKKNTKLTTAIIGNFIENKLVKKKSSQKNLVKL